MIGYAKPIWIDEEEKNQYIEAKQSFVVEKVEAAVLQIYADTEYVVYLNGRLVGTGQYCCFQGKRAYDEYDVEEYIAEGDNELVVTAYSAGEDSQTYQKDVPVLGFTLVCGKFCVFFGSETLVRRHPYYESGELEKVSFQLGYTFHYDARGELHDWQHATVQPITFYLVKRPVKKLVPMDLVEGNMVTQGMLFRIKSGTPAEMLQSDGMCYCERSDVFDGNRMKLHQGGAYFVLDLGKEYAGLFSMMIEATEGTVLEVGWGEHLEDLRVRTGVGGRNFAFRYICRSGKQEFTGFFRRLSGRYLQIHVTHMNGQVHFEKIGLIPLEYPLQRTGGFWCNDYLLQKIYQTAEQTLKLCMHEHYEDCPWREQALYGFDSYVQMLCGYYIFGEYDYAKASLRLLAEGQWKEGLLPICAPCGVKLTIPGFSLIWIMSLEKYVLYSGDVSFGREMLPVAEKILGAFPVENDLIRLMTGDKYWHFYEWTEGLSSGNGEAVDAVSNCYYILAYEAYRRLCGYSEATVCENIYHELDQMRSAVRDTFYDSARGLFRTRRKEERYHELTQALAVCSGVTRDSRILDEIAGQENGLIKVSLSTSLFKYEALLENGDRYVESVMEEIASLWGKMIYNGASSFWEVPEGAQAFDRAGSLCHGWSAVPAYLFYKYYLGFEPKTPGFGEYRLQPRFVSHMTEMAAWLLTPKWEKLVKMTKVEK